MNKKTLRISTLSGVSIFGLILTLGIIPSMDNSEINSFEVPENFSETLGTYSESLSDIRSPPPTPISAQYEKRSNTVDEALAVKEIANVKKPNLIPQGFKLKAVFSQDNMISQFYMLENKEITDDTTFRDVLDEGGFVIIQNQEDSEFNKQNWIDNYGKGEVTYSKIGDSKVIVIDNDGTKEERSQLFFYNGDTFVNFVSVSLDAKHLLKIANSMY